MALQSTNLFEPGRFTLEADEGKLVCRSRRYTMMFCYPADAGQDYAIIERARGMRSRIVDDGEADWAEAINEAYIIRSADETARIYEGVLHERR